jgi:hypothetical protein
VSTVRLRVRVTPDDLLEAVSQLDQAELDQFVARVLSLRARRQGPCLSDDESRLLQQINQGLPEPAASRYWELMDRRRAGTLTHEEHQELLGLTDQAEMLEAARAEAILELARLRDKPVDAVLQELGIPASDG